MMRRLKLTIEYEGTSYCGWQKQKNKPTIQQTIEDALQDFLKETVTVWGSGRTDAGVHAKRQVAHIDIAKPYPPFSIQGGMNQRLKNVPITIVDVEEVPPSFHARFSAISREYEYYILNRRTSPAIDRERAWWVIRPLCLESIQKGAEFLIGHHDFTSFRDSQCQALSPIKTLDDLSFEKTDDLIIVKAKARSFLHHQVRNMVGTLKRVGEGVWSPEKVKEILEAKDRKAAGPTAPAHGLFLTNIRYD